MVKEYLTEVFDKFAQVTKVILEVSQIKDYFDHNSNDRDLKVILEKTKIEVDNLYEQASDIKETFFKQYEQFSDKLTLIKDELNEGSLNGNGESSTFASDASNSSKNNAPMKPLIKVIDIQKLVEPKGTVRPPVIQPLPQIEPDQYLDDTIVLISSSDDESKKSKRTIPRSTAGRIRPTSQRKAAKETKWKTKQCLETILKSDLSSDEESIVQPQSNNKSKRITRNLDNVVLSDASSESDVPLSAAILSNKTIKTKHKTDPVLTKEFSENDPKLKAQCLVKVLKVPCEQMKEYYLDKLENLEINRLCDISSLKRKKAIKSTSGSDSEENLSKRKKSYETQKDSDPVSPQDPKCPAEEVSGDVNERGSDDDKDTSVLDPTNQSLIQSNSDQILNDHAELALNILQLDNDHESNNISEEVEKQTSDNDTTIGNLDGESNENVEEATGNEYEVSKGEKNGKESGRKTNGKKNGDEVSETSEVQEPDKSDNENSKSAKSSKADCSWRKDKLLQAKLSSSESEDEVNKLCRKTKTMQEDVNSGDESQGKKKGTKKRLMKKKMKKIISDSENDNDDVQDGSESSSSDSDKEQKTSSESEEITKAPRKRVKRVADSSEEEDDEKSTRKHIRNIWSKDSLAETTKQAEAEEKERKARIAEKQKKYNQVYDESVQLNAKVDKVVLDFDEKTQEELLKVDDHLVSKLKPHQASGVQFMWDACFESIERAKNTKGSGCILAHCMGLGKTLQVIALSHTLIINHERTQVRKVMVVTPLNTVLNWVGEFKLWLPDLEDYDVYELVSSKQNHDRQYQVKTWHSHGGVLVIGYDMFRNLSNPENKRLSKKLRAVFHETLVDPGPDLVICDEGHLLKNEKTHLSKAMNRLKTLRRIVLTGTPLQNNLKEYFCMVQFIKPNLLGTYKEYLNRFVNPITNGQYTDSTPQDIQIMRRRSHVLHKMLDGVVQRRDYAVLAPYLPPKYEYVLFINLTETQIKLYEHYMTHFARKSLDGSNRTSFLFIDFQSFQRICTHPRVLLDKSNEMKLAKEKNAGSDEDSEGSLRDFIDDEEEESSDSDSSSDNDDNENDEDKQKKRSTQKKRVTRAAAAAAKDTEVESLEPSDTEPEKEWWQEYCDGDHLNNIQRGSKLWLLFEILKECEQIGDKVLVFSQSLSSLNIIEYFLELIHDATEQGKSESVGGYSGSWCLGLDYFRLDGSSSCDNRSAWCKTFNNPGNTRARLFLISTRAGGLGINLVAANRVIIFDVSWNPSHDIQSIYRVYRFGQTKPSYIYRFVTQGTMEMKIYERQVTKQAISKRVIDEQQIDRHYNQNDLQELYKFDPSPQDRPTPLVPKDVLLGELLQKFADKIYRYHEHQSLLENKEDEGLNEEERKAAWEEFENEKKQRTIFGNQNARIANIEIALSNLIRKENPSLTELQIQSMIPTLHATLQHQVASGDLTLYRKLQQEIQILHAIQNQQLREQFYRQQAAKLLQQQQMATAMKLIDQTKWAQHYLQKPGTSQESSNLPQNPSDVIDLND